MSATEHQRFNDLLIYGSCDGGIPDILADHMKSEMVEHEGRTYWIGPQGNLAGKSLVQSMRDQMVKRPS